MRVRGTALALSGLTTMVVVALAAAGLRPAGAAGTATVQITPPSSYVQTGSTVDVSVNVQNLTAGLGVYEFRLGYDTTSLEYVAAANTGFLGSTGRAVSCKDESEPGEVIYYCTSTGSVGQDALPGPTGAGELTQVRFKGLAQGQAPLHFTKLELGVEFGFGIEITDYGEAVITVGSTPPADPDGDDDGSDGDGSSNAATPTRVPRALTPTIPAGAAAATPTPNGDDIGVVYNPDDAYQAPRPAAAGVLGDSGGAPSGSVGASGTTGSNSNFPVAGAGPQAGGGRFEGSALMATVLAGGLLVCLGMLIARRKQEA